MEEAEKQKKAQAKALAKEQKEQKAKETKERVEKEMTSQFERAYDLSQDDDPWPCQGGCGLTWDGWDRAGLGCASQACVEGAKRVWYLWSQCDGGDVVWCPTCFTQDEITEHEAACPKLNARKRKQAADRLGSPRPSKQSKVDDGDASEEF